MSMLTAPAFPGSRILAGWWRQLSSYRPDELWVGHLSLHHVEAFVELTRPCRLDPFTLLVLGAVRLEHARSAAEASAQQALRKLNERLHLGPGLLRQILRTLETQGLATENGSGAWALTPLGEQALDRGEYALRSQERRCFHFVQPRGGQIGFHYLNLNSHSNLPAPVNEPWEFDPAVLQASLTRSAEWKARYGFPVEVSAILGLVPGTVVPDWQQVIVDRPERLLAVMIRVQGDGKPDRLLGFTGQQEGWTLQAGSPAFVIEGHWDELFPEVSAGLTADAWRHAWAAWCQPRSLPEADVVACVLEPSGGRLSVRAPSRLVERLRAARSDAVKGEAWLLAGEGLIRRATLIELTEAPED